VTPLVTAAVLFAAVTHASWNAIAHKITDKLVGLEAVPGLVGQGWPFRVVWSAARSLAGDHLRAFPCGMDHLFANRRHVRWWAGRRR